MNKKHQV